MSTSISPSLPDGDSSSVWRAHLRAVAFLTPSLLAWWFAVTFLLPKVEMLWHRAGLPASKAAWLIGSAASLTNWVFVLLGVVGALLLLEFCWPAWPRYRRIVLTCATLFFQSAVLVGITTLAIAACLAAPMFDRGQ